MTDIDEWLFFPESFTHSPSDPERLKYFSKRMLSHFKNNNKNKTEQNKTKQNKNVWPLP